MIVARYIAESIAVDDLDHPAWDKCEPVKIEHYWSGEPAAAARHAEARVCWSDEALHVRFVGEQHEPLVVAENQVLDKKTLGLWDRDVCEIFVAPDREHPERYFEFEAAPTGEWV
ncbi:MAG TPA: sugar-binding protein, partial [Pyrinomonadaceae bacterium]|nr:sugar-binding protein [Pyrinomonadaceae bacterium]